MAPTLRTQTFLRVLKRAPRFPPRSLGFSAISGSVVSLLAPNSTLTGSGLSPCQAAEEKRGMEQVRARLKAVAKGQRRRGGGGDGAATQAKALCVSR